MPQHRPLARSDGRVNARLSPARARPLPSTPSAEGTAWGRTPKPNKKRRRPRSPVGTRCPSTRTCTASTRPGPAHLRGHPARKPRGLAPAVLPPGGTGRRLGTSVVVTPGRGQGCRSAPAVSRTAPQRTTAGQGDPAPISVGTCTRRGQHTLDPGVLGPGRACASGRPRPPAGRPRRGPSPALRVSVGFGRGRGGRERRRVPAAEWHLVTVTSPFVCRLNRSLGGYI